jgi:hypothetical protein
MTDSRSSRGHSIREQVQYQPNLRENILEHCNNLQSQDILPTVISNLENRRLPDVVFCLDKLRFVGNLDRVAPFVL